MYFKTKKDSETGKKIRSLFKKAAKADREVWKLVKELGGKTWTKSTFYHGGGFVGIIFPEEFEFDTKIWSKPMNSFGARYPKRNIKAGKNLNERFNQINSIPISDYGKVLGIPDPFYTPSINVDNVDFYLIMVSEKYAKSIPEDCIEITYREYQELLESNNKKAEVK